MKQFLVSIKNSMASPTTATQPGLAVPANFLGILRCMPDKSLQPSITFFTRKKAENVKLWWPDLEAVLMTSLILLLSSFSTDEARESSGDPDEEASLSIKCSNDE